MKKKTTKVFPGDLLMELLFNGEQEKKEPATIQELLMHTLHQKLTLKHETVNGTQIPYTSGIDACVNELCTTLENKRILKGLIKNNE